MMQELIVGILFIVAITYLFQLFRKEFTRKEGCGGCGTCSAADIEKIAKQIKNARYSEKKLKS